VAVSGHAEVVETRRGRFFGVARDVARPYLVERGIADDRDDDDRPIAALLVSLEIPSGGQRDLAVLLGQADDVKWAAWVVRKYRSYPAAQSALEATRHWWHGLMATLRVRTDQPDLDRYLDWLKYQVLAERIWARRGFYQASGAFGFRDQLQDSVNLIWVDPGIARRQILLHAAQQFLEGDVVHWFHLLQDGRTGFVGRTHASDNLLWLAWATVEYVGQTGDDSILDERVAYLESDQPLEPLPAGKGGAGFDPLRSTREETLYRHAMRAIDLVLDRRMGLHGLPLMGTGDWNDGLDEIGSQGRGESVWLALFLAYILDRMVPIITDREGAARREHYSWRLEQLRQAIEGTWRGDRYLRAFHDNGTEIGVRGSGVWEIDALNAAWAVLAGVDHHRGETVFHTALSILETEKTIMLGWPPLREDTHPYLGRSSVYPAGVRENGMYCHGVQWLVAAARILGERAEREGRIEDARVYFDTAYRLWRKIAPLDHAEGPEIETFGGQPNQQAADLITTFDPGRMIWNGYTGAAGWMLRQALEGVLGFRLIRGELVAPQGSTLPEAIGWVQVDRDLNQSPLPRSGSVAAGAQRCEVHQVLRTHQRQPS
jgi:cyclic beta-1,2-glucan synthetase